MSEELLPESIEDIKSHFKIAAGPGAGKTTWLVGHINNVLTHSDVLNKMQKIACITYTRVAADTIERKINEKTYTKRLDVGTIHSFLYRNVVKPFAYLISEDENGDMLFNIKELNGHTDNNPSIDRISSWVNKVGNKFYYLCKKEYIGKTIDVLKSFKWLLSDGTVNAKVKNNDKDFQFPSSKIYEFKLTNWQQGVMDHEDVLYFTYVIFNKNPRAAKLLSQKYPFIFIDEFQDTTPLQTWIMNKIAENGSTIGVIGDSAQSIYGFTGAKRSDFIEFSLDGLKCYFKPNNYRSSKKIIKFLNSLRNDLKQISNQDTPEGVSVTVIVGNVRDAADYIKQTSENYVILCRSNSEVVHINNNISIGANENLIRDLYVDDNAIDRVRFINSILIAYDCLLNGHRKDAIREIKKHFKDSGDGFTKRLIAIRILEYIKQQKDMPLNDIFSELNNMLKSKYRLKGFTSLNKVKEIHKKRFIEFLPYVAKQFDLASKVRTIHQAKGDEFECVMVCFSDKGNLKLETSLDKYLFSAKKNINEDNKDGEEARLRYVAFSRAKKHLYIQVPRCEENEKEKFQTLGLEIKYL